MNIRKVLTITLFIVVLVGGAVLATGTPSPLGIVPAPNPSSLTVNIWTNKPRYAIGENAQIIFSVNQQAFVYIYDIQPDGVVRLIFPNALSHNNYVAPGTHTLPDGNYRLVVSPPPGVEQLQIIASTSPLNLAPTQYSEPFPWVGPDPQSAGNTIRGHIMGVNPGPCTPCAGWATAWTSFTIVPGYSYSQPGYCLPPIPPVPPVPPCSGCVSGNWYWYNGSWHYGTPPNGTGWYWYIGPDGSWHFRIQIRIGNN